MVWCVQARVISDDARNQCERLVRGACACLSAGTRTQWGARALALNIDRRCSHGSTQFPDKITPGSPIQFTRARNRVREPTAHVCTLYKCICPATYIERARLPLTIHRNRERVMVLLLLRRLLLLCCCSHKYMRIYIVARAEMCVVVCRSCTDNMRLFAYCRVSVCVCVHASD